MTDIKLNTLIEWTAEDRAKGKCPVPRWSKVTVWLSDGRIQKDEARYWNWTDCNVIITAYLIHSVPREPIVRWIIVDGASWPPFERELAAQAYAEDFGGRVVKMVEEME